jgi:hypothetical protein
MCVLITSTRSKPGSLRTGNGSPKLPVLQRLPDGSRLSRFGGIPVRVIGAEITVTTSTGQATGGFRLVTTLTDPARYPARDLAVLYHERWVRHEVAWSEWNSQKEDWLMLVT